MASMSRWVSRRSSRRSMLVMLELRMSSSLTTLSMSFFESWSTMRIFHCALLVLEAPWSGSGHAHVAAGHLADGVENHCGPVSAAARGSMRMAYVQWTPTLSLDFDHGHHLGGVGCRRREDGEGGSRRSRRSGAGAGAGVGAGAGAAQRGARGGGRGCGL